MDLLGFQKFPIKNGLHLLINNVIMMLCEINLIQGMMIFDANSGEFWQIFARQGMRNPHHSQPSA